MPAAGPAGASPLALGSDFIRNSGVNPPAFLLLTLCVFPLTCVGAAPPSGKMESLAHMGSIEKAYISLPEVLPVGGLVLVPDWWGLTERFRKAADAFAADGYIVVAVDFYDGKVPKSAADAQSWANDIHRPGALRIIHSAIRLLHEDRRLQVPKIGLMGWSTGAGLALESAIGNPEVAACVLYYGPTITDSTWLRQLRAPLLGIYGKKDAWITPEVVRDFRKSLEAAGARFDFFNFDGPHMFASPSSADYDAKVSAEARKYVTAFLKKHVFVFIAPPVPDR